MACSSAPRTSCALWHLPTQTMTVLYSLVYCLYALWWKEPELMWFLFPRLCRSFCHTADIWSIFKEELITEGNNLPMSISWCAAQPGWKIKYPDCFSSISYKELGATGRTFERTSQRVTQQQSQFLIFLWKLTFHSILKGVLSLRSPSLQRNSLSLTHSLI